jgi:ADP-heptose:LPS heptosyltransferase
MGDKLNIRNAVYHGLNTIFQSLVWNTQVTFRDSFIKYVFHFSEDVEPIYPVFPKRKEQVLEQFKKYGLKPGKTVVISPYAGHFIAQISEAHWNKLILELEAKGFTVCTNCGGQEELPLPRTQAPFIELQDCVEFVEAAGYFIGVRSGFCDLICMANCKKIVIYETGAPAASIDYFGFKSMGIGENIVELINDCIHVDELIDGIVEKYFQEE